MVNNNHLVTLNLPNLEEVTSYPKPNHSELRLNERMPCSMFSSPLHPSNTQKNTLVSPRDFNGRLTCGKSRIWEDSYSKSIGQIAEGPHLDHPTKVMDHIGA